MREHYRPLAWSRLHLQILPRSIESELGEGRGQVEIRRPTADYWEPDENRIVRHRRIDVYPSSSVLPTRLPRPEEVKPADGFFDRLFPAPPNPYAIARQQAREETLRAVEDYILLARSGAIMTEAAVEAGDRIQDVIDRADPDSVGFVIGRKVAAAEAVLLVEAQQMIRERQFHRMVGDREPY